MSEANLEQQAKEIGWTPKEEFKGDPDKWVDAEAYISRGETVLPILRKTNANLRGELTSVRGEVENLKTALAESRSSMEELTKFQSEFTAERVKAARKELLERLKAAKTDNDVATEVELTDELSRLNAREVAVAEEKKAAPPAEERKVPSEDPVFAQWVGENPWFLADPERQSIANGIAQSMRANPATRHIVGRPFLDLLTERVNKVYGGGRETVDRVEGGRISGNGGGGNGKSFSDLPTEARETCSRQAARFVGDNKAFKDLKAWQDHYAKVFFAGE